MADDPLSENERMLVEAVREDGAWAVYGDPDGTAWRLVAIIDRLLPVSAEAGDTEPTVPMPPTSEVHGPWMGGGLEITYPSAEAGDTDA